MSKQYAIQPEIKGEIWNAIFIKFIIDKNEKFIACIPVNESVTNVILQACTVTNSERRESADQSFVKSTS